MVRLTADKKIKSSARRCYKKATAIYVPDGSEDEFEKDALATDEIPRFTPSSLFSLIGYLKWNRSIFS
jgi:hypothetical protein